MDDVLHTFKKGHRIMLHIQSSWFPLVDRNPHKFVDIYRASASDFTKATERVYRSAEQASRIELPVLP
jgi:predicted acyl esterase